MSDSPNPTQMLVLHIEVPGIWADDLTEDSKDVDEIWTALDVLTETVDPVVSLTMMTQDESSHYLHAYRATVVGAHTRPLTERETQAEVSS